MSLFGHELVFQRRGLFNFIGMEVGKIVLYSTLAFTTGVMYKGCSSSNQTNFARGLEKHNNFNIVYLVENDTAKAFLAYKPACFEVPIGEAENQSLKSLYRTYVRSSLDDVLGK
jgi:hypothetical protein